jgi:hypothetical protein
MADLTAEAVRAMEVIPPDPLVLALERSIDQSKFFTALAKAQGEFTTVEATTENDYYHSKYAPLSVIWEHIRPVLAKHQFCVIQEPMPSPVAEGCLLRTTIAHASGEWRSATILMPVDLGKEGKGKKAPAFGSAQSYARRYALTALLGIAPRAEDDDGGGFGSANRDAITINSTEEERKEKGWHAWCDVTVAKMREVQSEAELSRFWDALQAQYDDAIEAVQKRLINVQKEVAKQLKSKADPMDPDGDIPQ